MNSRKLFTKTNNQFSNYSARNKYAKNTNFSWTQ